MSDKEISKFLEFEEEEPKKSEGFGISETKARKVGKLKAYVVCPNCCLSRPIIRTGAYAATSQKRKRAGTAVEHRSLRYHDKTKLFSNYDFENAPFISLRELQGRGGWVEMEIIRMKDIKNIVNREDKRKILDILKELREQCRKILNYTEDMV